MIGLLLLEKSKDIATSTSQTLLWMKNQDSAMNRLMNVKTKKPIISDIQESKVLDSIWTIQSHAKELRHKMCNAEVIKLTPKLINSNEEAIGLKILDKKDSLM